MGLNAGLVPPRVDAHVKAGLLELVEHAAREGDWSTRKAAGVLGLDHVRVLRWRARAVVGRLDDAKPGPEIALHALQVGEVQAGGLLPGLGRAHLDTQERLQGLHRRGAVVAGGIEHAGQRLGGGIHLQERQMRPERGRSRPLSGAQAHRLAPRGNPSPAGPILGLA